MPEDRPDLPQPPSDEEIAKRLRQALGEVRGEEPVFSLSDDEVDRRATEIDGQIERAAKPEIPDLPTFPEIPTRRPASTMGPGRDKADSYLGLGVGISVAYSMIGLTALGWGIGKLIDMRSGSSLGQAIGTLLGAVIGLAGGIFQIVRAQNKQEK